MAHIRVDELIVIDNMEQRAVLHGINADILRLVVIVRAISCELHANRAGVRIDRDYLLLSAVRRVIGEIKHAIIDRAALYSVELLFERYRAQESHCFEVILKYLADIVELRDVEISVFPVYRAPRDAVGQILARHIIIYPGIFERFAVIEQDEIIQMLSVNLALDRRVYIAVGAADAADVIAAVYPQRKLLCLQQNGRDNRRKMPFSGNEAKIYSLSPSGMTQKAQVQLHCGRIHLETVPGEALIIDINI